ncbi:MAG TPA: D-alanyl-D-alanine carboxypeptidase, partial [Selenomonas sp.]|nr:D-alanyl-D-alanine carboxypeptidase [Selenomonas sp.]
MGLLRVSFLWIFTFLLVLGSSLSASAAEAPAITADSAILVEATTGRVVYEKNADEERPPASMTKMMTCILALEQLRPRTLVTISPVAANTEDVALDWKPGEQLEAQELLKALMMISENGAAVALAQHISGNLPRFSTLMTEKAAELGCKNTQLMNPNGLPNSAHYSTARDMAKIAMYCMKNKEFRNLVGQVKSDIRWTSPKGKSEVLENTNELLETYPGATGIKTGWTSAAGGCLAASAKRNGVELIVI